MNASLLCHTGLLRWYDTFVSESKDNSQNTCVKVLVTMAPAATHPFWEVTGRAVKGYITISVMTSGNIDVKQGTC